MNNKLAYEKEGGGPFRMTRSMRMGTIIFQEDERTLEIEWEFAGSNASYDLVVLGGFSNWVSPKNSSVPLPKQLEILEQLRAWLKQHRIKSSIDLPDNIEVSNGKCAWEGCNQKSLKDKYICLYHFNLVCLGFYSQHNPRSTRPSDSAAQL